MVDPERVRVWVARLAAPVAFFFAATVLVILVQRGFEDDPDATPSTTGAVANGPAATGTGTGTTAGPNRRRIYRVRAGDTLESIARRFEVDVAVLLELNPNIDPLALTPGQVIRLRPRAA